MKETLSRKYILILATVAVGILVLGGLLRPKKQAMEVPSPTESASLERRVRREEVGNIGQFLADRAAAASEHVIYLPDRGASAVIWVRRRQALSTTAAGRAGAPLSLAETDSASTPASTAAGINPERWILVVGRSADQQPLWTAALDGGSKPASCGGIAYRELLLNTPLDSSLAGAGAFDLDGNLAGVVARCGESYHVISVASIPAVLQAGESPEYKLEANYGLHAIPLKDAGEALRKLFPPGPGLLVTEVRMAGAADLAGLLPGDVIAAAAGIADLSETALWGALERGDTVTLTILRDGRKREVQLKAGATESGAGIHVVTPDSALSISVTPGTPAYRAGLRTGDRIVALNGRLNPRIAEIQRVLSGIQPGQTAQVIYERDSTKKLAVVSK